MAPPPTLAAAEPGGLVHGAPPHPLDAVLFANPDGSPSSCAPLAPKLVESTQSELSRTPRTMDWGGGALAAGHEAGAARRQGDTDYHYQGDGGRPAVTMAEVLHGAGVLSVCPGALHMDRMGYHVSEQGGGHA